MTRFCLLTVLFLVCSCRQDAFLHIDDWKTTINLPAGQKLVTATWKDDNGPWLLTRPMRPGESPETYTFAGRTASTDDGLATIIEH